MPTYPIEWKDYRLPTGREFSVAICGYSGKICHMYLGNDVLRRSFIRQLKVEGQNCTGAEHCLALKCPLNKTTKEHVAHMLDMHEDESLDAETAKMWETESAAEGLVKFVERLNQEMEEQAEKAKETEKETTDDSCAAD